MPQLPQGLRLDLPDALARDVERAADLLEGVLGAVADAEAHLEDLLLAGRQRLQHPARLILEVRHQDRLDRREDLPVLDEVAQMRILLLADRSLERDGLLRDLHDLADLRDGHVHPLRDLLGVRLAAELLHERPRRARQLVDRLDHVDRDADRARLVRDRARDRLPDPPRRVGRELVAALVLELVDRAHEADVPLLDQVEELEPAVHVALGDRHDEAEVRLDELLLCRPRTMVCAADAADGTLQHRRRHADVPLELPHLAADTAELLGIRYQLVAAEPYRATEPAGTGARRLRRL